VLKLQTKLLSRTSTKTKIELIEETMGKSSPFQTMASFNGLMKARKGSQASADWVLDAVLDGIQCGFCEISDLKSSAFYGKGSSKSPDGRADLQASAARLLAPGWQA
jgi:hypothetical protein